MWVDPSSLTVKVLSFERMEDGGHDGYQAALQSEHRW